MGLVPVPRIIFHVLAVRPWFPDPANVGLTHDDPLKREMEHATVTSMLDLTHPTYDHTNPPAYAELVRTPPEAPLLAHEAVGIASYPHVVTPVSPTLSPVIRVQVVARQLERSTAADGFEHWFMRAMSHPAINQYLLTAVTLNLTLSVLMLAAYT